MDILKFGADVEVIEPEELRAAVARRLAAADRQYRQEQALVRVRAVSGFETAPVL